jgi:hypothetical protein
MIPSRTWFPSSLAERALWMDNFATQFASYAAVLGFTAAEVTSVTLDNEEFQWLADTNVAAKNFASAVAEFRVTLTEGDIGDPAAVFPFENFTGPPHGRDPGMFERIDNLRKRILASPNYTDEIGIALGIVGEGGDVIAESEVKPEIECFPAATGYMFSIVVSKRYNSDSWQVWATPAGVTDWKILTAATGKSTDVVVGPTGEVPAPVQLQVRVQLRRSNQNYGEPSDIAQVTVNP